MTAQHIVERELGKVSGHISIKIVGKDGEIKYQGEPYCNLITDYGFDYVLGNNVSWLIATTWCGVGTSSTPPAFTDVACGSQVGTRTNTTQNITNTNSGSPNYIVSYVRTFAFTQGQVSGNLTEVIFASAGSGNTASSRSLIKDGGGNPTTLTVLSTDTLYITYELRWVPNLTDTSGTHVISGVSYGYVQRTKGVTGVNTAIDGTPLALTGQTYESNVHGALGSAPSGAPQNFNSGTPASYSAGTKYRDITFVGLPANNNHATGIGIVAWGTGGNSNGFAGFYTAYTPTKIPKINTQTLTIVYRYSMARA